NLQDRPEPDAPVPHAGHLAHASIEEAVEAAAEAHAGAGLGLVAPLCELRAVLARVRAEQIALAEVRHRSQVARQLEDREELGRYLPRELEHAARDAREAEADRRAALQVVAEEHAGAEAQAEVIREPDVVPERRTERQVAGLGDTDHRAAVHLARGAAE